MENKTTKRLGAGLGLLLAGVMGVGAVTSGAWFTEQHETGVTRAESGSLDAIVVGAGKGGNDLNKGFTVSNMAPADTVDSSFRVKNTGTLDLKYRITATEIAEQQISTLSVEEQADLYDQINATVVRRDWTGVCYGDALYTGRLSGLEIVNSLKPNGNHDFCVQLELDENAGNEYENLSTTFKVVVDVTQANNPGWGTTTEVVAPTNGI